MKGVIPRKRTSWITADDPDDGVIPRKRTDLIKGMILEETKSTLICYKDTSITSSIWYSPGQPYTYNHESINNHIINQKYCCLIFCIEGVGVARPD
jgi:hypothetical protein